MLPELIASGVDGLVINDTPEELAEAILFMIENPDQRCMMAENARRKALRLFDLEQQTRRVVDVYETLLRRASARRTRHAP